MRIVVVLIALALLAARKPDALLTPQLIAEDGGIFLQQARDLGLAAFAEPHSGYYHGVPRLVAWITSAAPLATIPLLYNLAALLVAGLVCWSATSPRVLLRGRLLLPFALVLVPHGGEVFLNLTNVQSWLAIGMLLVPLSREPTRKSEAAVDIGWLVAAGISGPWVILFLPLWLALAVIRRTPPAVGMALGALVLAIVQAIHLPSARLETSAAEAGWTEVFGARFAGVLFAGPALLDDIPATALTVLGLLLLAGLAWRALADRDRTLAAVLYAVAAVTAATFWAYRGAPGELVGRPDDRYSWVPLVLVLWSLVHVGALAGAAAIPARIAIAAALLSAAQAFVAPAPPDMGWSRASRHLDGPVSCRVPIHPPGWFVSHTPETDLPLAARLDTFTRLALKSRPVSVSPDGSLHLTFRGGEAFVGAPTGAVFLFDPPVGTERVSVRCVVGPPSRDWSRYDAVEFLVGSLGGRGPRVLQRRRVEPLSPGGRNVYELEADVPAESGVQIALSARPEAHNRGTWSVAWGAVTWR